MFGKKKAPPPLPEQAPAGRTVLGRLTHKLLLTPKNKKVKTSNIDRPGVVESDRRGRTPKPGKHAPVYYQPGDPKRAKRGN